LTGRVPVQPRQELHGAEGRLRLGQQGLHCLDRGPLSTFAQSNSEDTPGSLFHHCSERAMNTGLASECFTRQSEFTRRPELAA
jgi:hypothetical protein